MSDRPLAVTVAEFRAYLPVFGNSAEYPDDAIGFWLQEGSNQCDPLVWRNLLKQGVIFFTAHMLTLMGTTASSKNGQAGLELSKTVGKVSVDYDTTAVSMKDGGPWNATSYGTQFLFYARMVGSGPKQITGPMVFPPFYPVVVF